MTDTAAGSDTACLAEDVLGQLVRRLAHGFARDAAENPCRVIETHISYVLLAGVFAYKFKKPVDFGFVDFTTLSRRRHFCEREIELNRRLAPDIYLDVVTIGGTLDEPRLAVGGHALEYAVKMRRFDERARGDCLLEHHVISLDDVSRLARDIAGFHGSAERAAPDSDYGALPLIRRQMLDNLQHLLTAEPDHANRERYRKLGLQTRAQLERFAGAFAQRKERGFIRDCHGDLHLTNLVGLDGRLVPFDCIEFNDALRIIDVLSDIAFLVMDLELRGRADLASRYLNTYLEETGDYDGLSVLPTYLVYRSLVRAKVALLQGLASRASGQAQHRLHDRAEAHLALAERYRNPPAKPALFLMHGLSGSGKSRFSQMLADGCGAIRIRSDIERKRLQDLAPLEHSASSIGGGIYTPAITQATYEHLLGRAEVILGAGFSVIVDASFLKQAERQKFSELARRQGARIRILDCRASLPSLRRRLEQRARSAVDASEATIEVLENQLRDREPLTPEEQVCRIVIDTADERTVSSQLSALGAGHEGAS